MIKTVIFDCFGVIYPDTLTYLESRFIPANDERVDEIRLIRRQADIGVLTRDEFWDATARIMNISRLQLDQKLDEIKGADWELLEYVKQLKQKYKTAILSNVGRGFLERIFDKERPSKKYFDELVASAEIGIMKPDRQSFLITADRLQVRPQECIMIDDQQVHVSGAREAGMQTILYQNFEQMKTELEILLAKG